MAKPQLLMLDEPSLGLAPRIVREIFHIIARLRETGVAILLVEQNARAALQVADYGYVLETGEVTLHGPARELAGDPKVIGLSRPGQGRRQVRRLIASEAAAAGPSRRALQRSNTSTTRKLAGEQHVGAVAAVALEVGDVPVAPRFIRAFPSATAKASSTWSKRWITTLTVSITQAGRPGRPAPRRAGPPSAPVPVVEVAHRSARGGLGAGQHQGQQLVGQFGAVAELEGHGVLVRGGRFHAGDSNPVSVPGPWRGPRSRVCRFPGVRPGGAGRWRRACPSA